MRQKRLILSLVFLTCIGIFGLHAQTAIPVSGGNALGSGGKVSYSIGQIFYNTNIGTNGSVHEGVQHAVLIETIDGIEEATDIRLYCSAYPNPATNILTLNVDNFNNENLSYQLIDLSGKSIETKKITSTKTTISLANLIPAMYFLIVKSQLQEIKTFQIIKK